MDQEKKKGLFIEEELVNRFDLTWNEKVVYVQIRYLTSGVGLLPINNKTLSKKLGIEERTIRAVLASLFEKKLIMFKRKSLHSRTRYVMPYDKRTIFIYKQRGSEDGLQLEYTE